jgi:hypothetical protein
MLKMWHRILKIERPDAANDQDRIVKKAELMKKNFENTIQEIQFGEFKVKSSQGILFILFPTMSCVKMNVNKILVEYVKFVFIVISVNVQNTW